MVGIYKNFTNNLYDDIYGNKLRIAVHISTHNNWTYHSMKTPIVTGTL